MVKPAGEREGQKGQEEGGGGGAERSLQHQPGLLTEFSPHHHYFTQTTDTFA